MDEISNLTLGALISKASARSVINDNTEKISYAIKDFRNLIHPGRSLADGVSANQATAEIANALLSLVLDDIARSRMASPISTAADVFGAILSDPTKIHIVKFLVAPLSPDDFKALLLELIPAALIDAYSTSELETDDRRVDLLTQLFHVVYRSSSPEIQKIVAERYVRVLMDEPEAVVSVHTNCLFTIDFLTDLDSHDKEIVKENMKGRFKYGMIQIEDLPRYKSISNHFDPPELFNILQIFFRTLGSVKSDTQARDLADWIKEEFETYCGKGQRSVVKQLAEGWETVFRENKNLTGAIRTASLRNRLGDETSTYAFDEEPF
jgi:hypothetical protein